MKIGAFSNAIAVISCKNDQGDSRTNPIIFDLHPF